MKNVKDVLPGQHAWVPDEVFVVVEVVDYEGEYIRGIYLSREEAESRKKNLMESSNFPGEEEYEIRELSVGVDIDII
jgi:hypothetical protein